MKNLITNILTLIILTTYTPAESQNYYPFPDSNAIWNTVGENMFTFDTYRFRYGMYGDTIINSQTYQKIYDLYDTNLIHENSIYYAALRNENKKVFVKFPDHNEFILYDFTLEVGDTIWYNMGGCASHEGCDLWQQSHWKYVYLIDSVLLENGEQRKRWHFESEIMGDTWIEGFGSVAWIGLFNPLITDAILNGDGYEFACFKQDDEVVYLNNTQCEKCFCQLYTAIPLNGNIEVNDITIFPNPANGILHIKQLNPNISYNIELRNLYGQLVKEAKNIQSSHYTMNVSDLKPGVYFYLIRQQNEIIQQGKLITK